MAPAAGPVPVQQEDIDATERELGRLEGERLTTEDLAARDVRAAEARSR